MSDKAKIKIGDNLASTAQLKKHFQKNNNEGSVPNPLPDQLIVKIPLESNKELEITKGDIFQEKGNFYFLANLGIPSQPNQQFFGIKKR